MRRRDLLKAGSLLGAFGLSPRVALGAAPQDDWGQVFAEALEQDPRLLGWATPMFESIDVGSLHIEGTWPAEVSGTLWRNGPSIHDRHGLRYRHWFDGDGMVQEFRISDGAVSHRARLIATPKLSQEDAAGKRLFPAFGTHPPDGLPVRKPDDINSANISVLEHHGELLALWEGGSASRIDRDTLAWQAFKVWGEGFEGVPFTAHPKLDPDGTLWAFGYATGSRPLLVLYQISISGDLIKASIVPVDPLGMVHDFVVTERHLVFLIPPLVVDPGTGSDFISSHVWRPDLGTRALVVSKADFEQRRWYQLPATFGFHHGNGWEEADGTIRFDQCLAQDAQLVTHALRQIMRGEMSRLVPQSYAQINLRRDGTGEIVISDDAAEFPQISPKYVGLRNRYVYYLGMPTKASSWFRTIAKRDTETGDTESFDYGPGKIPEEHLFVPSGLEHKEDRGWLVGTFLDYERGVSGLRVFDARNLSDGPLATAWLPYPLPLGFHGCFRPHIS